MVYGLVPSGSPLLTYQEWTYDSVFKDRGIRDVLRLGCVGVANYIQDARFVNIFFSTDSLFVSLAPTAGRRERSEPAVERLEVVERGRWARSRRLRQLARLAVVTERRFREPGLRPCEVASMLVCGASPVKRLARIFSPAMSRCKAVLKHSSSDPRRGSAACLSTCERSVGCGSVQPVFRVVEPRKHRGERSSPQPVPSWWFGQRFLPD